MEQTDRYIRQLILPGFGVLAQNKLFDAKILIVGIGGLGCPALQYLVAAGVGTIGIVDPDIVSVSNLHRQILFATNDIGQQKVIVAAKKMKQLNESVLIEPYPFAINKNNAVEIISKYDLVIDGTDNFAAKYLLNDACVLLKRPLIYGAVSSYEGQLAVFNVLEEASKSINYRDLFPDAPKPGEIQNCEQTGVLGILPGIIGTMQAAEAIKLITGLGKSLYGRLLNYNLLQAKTYEIAITKNAKAVAIDQSFFDATEYDFICDDAYVDIEEINVSAFNVMKAKPNTFVLDVRERNEYPDIDFADARIPMSELKGAISGLPEKDICIICHQGIRSVYAAQLIKMQRNLNVYSVKGGLTAWFKEMQL